SACIDRYEKKRRQARKQLKRDLRTVKPVALRRFFVRTVHAPFLFNAPPDAADPFLSIDDFARESLDERLASVLALVPAACIPEEAASQHRLRIAVKRYRYRMEVLAPLMGEGYAEEHARVKAYQEILGRIHDLDVFAELIREIRLSEGTTAALAMLLAGKREKSFREFCRKLDTVPLDEIGSRIRSLL
ncbi:MAG TPA: CHAD domain-containing protein, partial [Geobacteraceae bacterium]|nr:CHAD domain-containing protein [Geobacteraceae bacterium]